MIICSGFFYLSSTNIGFIDCGILDDASANVPKKVDETGDKYEDFPEDQAPNGLSAEDTLRIATEVKDFGNKAYKAGDLDLGVEKYQKGLRYLNAYGPPTDDDPAEFHKQFNSLKFTLYSNSALLQNKGGNYRDADESATRALEVEGITEAEKAKALFRRGVAKIGQKDDVTALDDLKAAQKLVPGDAAIAKELEAASKRVQEKKDKEKQKYKKFFAS